MTINEFLNKCEESFPGKPYTTGQRAAFVQKLSRFSDDEVLRIYDQILTECKYPPKISDVYDAARILGMLAIDTTRTPHHHWTDSGTCGLCRGEGRLGMFWKFHYEDRNNGRVEIQDLSQVMQYSKSFDYQPKANEFRAVFRCQCFAGDAETLPKAWPKWTASSPTRREVWL